MNIYIIIFGLLILLGLVVGFFLLRKKLTKNGKKVLISLGIAASTIVSGGIIIPYIPTLETSETFTMNYFTAANFSYAVGVADMDNDGDHDMVVSGHYRADEDMYGPIRWYENDGYNVFTNASSHLIAAEGGLDVEIYDFDGNNYPEVVIANYGAGQVQLYYCGTDPEGTWTEYVVIDDYTTTYTVELGDIDNDGYTDIIAAEPGSGNVDWYYNNSGTVTEWSSGGHIHDGLNAHAVSIGYLDGPTDTALDVVITRGTSPYGLICYQNEGAGTFAGPPDAGYIINANTTFCVFSRIEDINDDGWNDIVTVGIDDDDIIWFENDGTPYDGVWSKNIIDNDVDRTRHPYTADINRDGEMDILVAFQNFANTTGQSGFAWYENNTGDSWTMHNLDAILDEEWGAGYIYSHDIDDDGDEDIIGCNPYQNNTYVFEQYGALATIRTNRTDYILWLGNNTTAGHVQTLINSETSIFTAANEYIYLFNKSATYANMWASFAGDGSGDNFTINTFDILKTNINYDSNDFTFYMEYNSDIDYHTYKNTSLAINASNKGYNYVGWHKAESTSLSVLNSTIGLSYNSTNSEAIGLWNETTYTWNWWFAGFSSNTNVNVYKGDVLLIKRYGTGTKYLNESDY